MGVKGLSRLAEKAVRSEAPPMERIEPSPVYELVVERIRRAIHIGTYVPGDRLPPERALAEQLGVSRTTVREAIRVLEGQGYVEIRRGAAGGVIMLDRGQTEERLGLIIRERLPELEEIVDFRIAVECRAARLAALRRTALDLKKLAAAVETMKRSLEGSTFRAADSAFHLGVAEAARNKWMRKAIEDARIAILLPFDKVADHVFRTAQLQHNQILDAIRRQDPDAAEKATEKHIEITRRDLRQTASAVHR
jgi:GntR family transcriptional repressor for pyruvate dehydrogenase complex